MQIQGNCGCESDAIRDTGKNLAKRSLKHITCLRGHLRFAERFSLMSVFTSIGFLSVEKVEIWLSEPSIVGSGFYTALE